jgi:O-antigen ligase
LLARYGVRGVLDMRKPWRLGVFCISVVVSMFAGFRSTFLLFAMTFALLFYLERLHRTWLLLPVVFALLTGGGLLVVFASWLPFPIQRSMAFLPIPLDPMAKLDAQGSTQWRVQMWKELVPQIPQYLILGKGYAFNASEQAQARGNTEAFELVGDYHNGPLSVILPFGIFGSIAFVWLLVAAIRVMYHNYQFGDPSYHLLNTFLFAYFVVKVIFFIAIFGSFHSDLPQFLGLLGLSISLNGGVAKPAVAPQREAVFNRLSPSHFQARSY